MAKKKNTTDATTARHFELVAALKVIALTPATSSWLLQHDPKALEQVCKALGMTLDDVRATLRAVEPDEDFVVSPQGSVVLFQAVTPAALAHVNSEVKPEGWQFLGTNSFAVDHRLAPDLCYQLREDGFTVVVR